MLMLMPMPTLMPPPMLMPLPVPAIMPTRVLILHTHARTYVLMMPVPTLMLVPTPTLMPVQVSGATKGATKGLSDWWGATSDWLHAELITPEQMRSPLTGSVAAAGGRGTGRSHTLIS